MAESGFTIGKLAKTAGVGVETIRFYQRRGLLDEPERPFRGVRRYTDHAVQRIRFIKEAQKLGFSLAEVAELLQLDEGMHCHEAQDVTLRKLTVIRARIAALRTMEQTLSDLAERCGRNAGAVSCPIIAALLGGATTSSR
jgi:MerR family mercuric resistance operon transcriptional regulator